MRLNDEELIRLGKETVHKQAEAVLNLEKQIDTSFAEAVKCIRRAEGHTIICGMGKSGHGREKGFEALYGFTVLKTVAAYHG